MSYAQNIEGCLEARVGAGGLSPLELAALLANADEALKDLRQSHTSGSLALLTLPDERDDLAACGDVVNRFKAKTTDIVIFGIGGSSLGGQALVQLTGHGTPGFVPARGAPRLHFFDNLDPFVLSKGLETFELSSTRFVIISKSGSTAETLQQALSALAAFKSAIGTERIKDHFVAIAEPGDNPLRQMAKTHGFPILDHNPGVGGRFSVLSNVGLLPAMLAGLDPVKVRQGAASVIDPILQGAKAADVAPALGAAIAIGLAEKRSINANVMMPYCSRLGRFSAWVTQLWAESLGKDGKGTTPIAALGPVDQHSQLQLFLSGPNDKFHTLITLNQKGQGPKVKAEDVTDPRLDYLAGRTTGDLVVAEQKASAETLILNGRPTRLIELSGLNEETLGALFMHFMLETIIAAHLLGVDPFDQPAVEQGKVLARQYLGVMTP